MGTFRLLTMHQDLRKLNLKGRYILLLDDLVLLIIPEGMIYICLTHQTVHGRSYPMWAKSSQMEVFIACRR